MRISFQRRTLLFLIHGPEPTTIVLINELYENIGFKRAKHQHKWLPKSLIIIMYSLVNIGITRIRLTANLKPSDRVSVFLMSISETCHQYGLRHTILINIISDKFIIHLV